MKIERKSYLFINHLGSKPEIRKPENFRAEPGVKISGFISRSGITNYHPGPKLERLNPDPDPDFTFPSPYHVINTINGEGKIMFLLIRTSNKL